MFPPDFIAVRSLGLREKEELTEGLLLEVDEDGAREGVRDDEGRGRQVVGSGQRVDTTLKVAVSGQDARHDEVALPTTTRHRDDQRQETHRGTNVSSSKALHKLYCRTNVSASITSYSMNCTAYFHLRKLRVTVIHVRKYIWYN